MIKSLFKVAEKLSEELFYHGFWGEHVMLDFDCLRSLRYTNMVVREVLRLTPPVLGGFRTALKTFEINVRRFTSVVYCLCTG